MKLKRYFIVYKRKTGDCKDDLIFERCLKKKKKFLKLFKKFDFIIKFTEIDSIQQKIMEFILSSLQTSNMCDLIKFIKENPS